MSETKFYGHHLCTFGHDLNEVLAEECPSCEEGWAAEKADIDRLAAAACPTCRRVGGCDCVEQQPANADRRIVFLQLEDDALNAHTAADGMRRLQNIAKRIGATWDAKFSDPKNHPTLVLLLPGSKFAGAIDETGSISTVPPFKFGPITAMCPTCGDTIEVELDGTARQAPGQLKFGGPSTEAMEEVRRRFDAAVDKAEPQDGS